MAHRIDLLGPCVEREVLVGRLLESVDDSELKAFVAMAARTGSAPIWLISLMGKRSQFLVAAQGLPPELSTVGVTDRSVSLCQKTVRDNARTEWEDASLDPDAPQGMVEMYGVRGYLGVPLVVDSRPVGSLCMVDVVPRVFSPHERQTLEDLGQRLSDTLQSSLSKAFERQQLHAAESEAVAPVFGELRNLLAPLGCAVSQAALSNAELQGAFRALRTVDADVRARLVSVLGDTLAASEDLGEILGELSSSSKRLTRSVLSMESLFDGRQRLKPLEECVASASHLAEHLTKIVGGVEVNLSAGAQAKVFARSVVPIVALILGAGARRLIDRKLAGGFRIRSIETRRGVAVQIDSPHWAEADLADCVARVEPLLAEDPSLTLVADAGVLELRFATNEGKLAC